MRKRLQVGLPGRRRAGGRPRACWAEGLPWSGQFIPVFPSCCGRLEASAGIGWARRATRSGSRRRRAGLGGEDAAAAVISAAEAGPTGLRRRPPLLFALGAHWCRPTQRRARRFIRPIRLLSTTRSRKSRCGRCPFPHNPGPLMGMSDPRRWELSHFVLDKMVPSNVVLGTASATHVAT
jgi:hypothetical protein